VIAHYDLARAEAAQRDDLRAAISRVVERGWYILGQEVETFEAQFADYCGSRHCVGVGNGLDALTLILMAYGIGPGDEVIVPSNGYIAAWLAITRAGATPVPAEPLLSTANLDPAAAEAAITSKTAAILAVHLYGQTADCTSLSTIASRHGLLLLEDAAQAHGATLDGVRAGRLGDAAGWSFYPTKNLGALGDAGAITTDDDAIATKVRLLRNYGSSVKYKNELLGVNSRLDELQAAVLITKLTQLDSANERRGDLAQRYSQSLQGLPGLALPESLPGAESVWHVYSVRHDCRDELREELTRRDIGTSIFYPTPPHLSEAYAGKDWGHLPLAEEHARTTLALPLAPYLTDAEVDQVLEQVHAAVTGLDRS
jgi:dTDP-4-amino-4,6-dideoxygalactose transaminase